MPVPRENPRPDRASILRPLLRARARVLAAVLTGLTLVVPPLAPASASGRFGTDPATTGTPVRNDDPREEITEEFEHAGPLPGRWIGDRDRFTTRLRGGSRWLTLRNEFGPGSPSASADTAVLATPSRIDPATWQLRVAHEVNWTSDRALRWYLTASGPDFTDGIRGYYLQLGGNNLDRIALYRADGAGRRRVLVGAGRSGRTEGETGSYELRAERTEEGRWEVYLDGDLEISALDSTYLGSRFTGFWMGYRRSAPPGLFVDGLRVSGSVDETPPRVENARYDTTSAILRVTFSEPIDPDRTDPGAFRIEPLVGPPAAARAERPPTRRVRLTFEPPLRPGRYALTAPGIADFSGNPLPFGYRYPFAVAGDTTAPRVLLLEGLRGRTGGGADQLYLLAHLTEPVDPASLRALTLTCRPAAVTDGAARLDGPRTVEVNLSGNRLPRSCRVAGVRDRTGHAVLPRTEPVVRRPLPGELPINEIMYRSGRAPPGPGPRGENPPEYVELWNRSDEPLSLYGLSLHLDGLVLVPTRPPAALPPHAYWVLFADPEPGGNPALRSRLTRAFPNRTFDPGDVRLSAIRRERLGLVDEGGTLTLHDLHGRTLETVPYDPSWHHPSLADPAGVSLERLSAAGSSGDSRNWSSSPARGTPGGPNAARRPAGPGPPIPAGTALELDPVPFFPDGDGWADELAVRGRFSSSRPVVRIRIFDARGRMVRELEPGRVTGPEHEWHWDGRSDAGGTLPTGIYVIVLEELDPDRGTTRDHREVAVLARSR